MRQTKREEMEAWLEANPGKTERDWLIEQRCSTPQQRSDLKRLLDLCDYLGVKYMFKNIDFIKELNDFCDENQDIATIQQFKDNCIKFIENECPVREYDLYLPSKHWIINIGEEEKDVDNQRQKNILNLSRLEDYYILAEFYGEFVNYLIEKYHYPSYDSENVMDNKNVVDKWYLPWGKDTESSKTNNLKTGSVSSFYSVLFKEDIEKARKKSIEDFLADKPDLSKQRTDMLHDHCKTLMNDKKLELGNFQIQKLLNQTDKELAATNPAFKEAALM